MSDDAYGHLIDEVEEMYQQAQADRKEHLGESVTEYAEAVGRTDALNDVLKLLRAHSEKVDA